MFRTALLTALAVGGLVLFGRAPVGGVPAIPSGQGEEVRQREAYAPLREFRPYPDVERLTVEGVVLTRVRRSDGSEALVVREESGWEQVVLEGFRLTFFSDGRRPLRPVAGRHIVMQDWSGGAHCCFDYYIFHARAGYIRREGLVRAGDCTLEVADVDHDGFLELIACDSRFAYAFDLPFAESPLIPLVYTFQDNRYVPDNRRYPQVFRDRIADEERRFAEAQQAGDSRGARRALVGLVLHMLYVGRVIEAWCALERDYEWPDREEVKQEILEGLRKVPDPDDLRAPRVDLSYALVLPDGCP